MENILRVSITVIETRVEVWENEKFKWHGNTRGPQGECFYAKRNGKHFPRIPIRYRNTRDTRSCFVH